VKCLSLLLLFATATAFTSCTTLANRRDLFRFGKGNGPWTQEYREMHRKPTVSEWKEQRRQWKEYERWKQRQ